jgi:hypothetical protein
MRTCATKPATIAQTLLPKIAVEKISPSTSSAKPRFPCSQTSQDSKTEYSKEVAMPAKMRPRVSARKFLTCFARQERMYTAQ